MYSENPPLSESWPGKVIELTAAGRTITAHVSAPHGDHDSVIVLVHGTGGDAPSSFHSVYPRLAAEHRVIGVDLVSVDGERTELSDLVDQVVGAIAAVTGGAHVHLVGYSLGAVVAASVALTRPAIVDSLTLLGGWAKTDEYRLLRSDIWTDLFVRDRSLLAKFWTLTSFSSSYLAARSSDEVAALVAACQVRPGAASQMELNRRIDISHEVGSITAPTLIVGGREDQTVPVRHSEMLAALIPGSRLVTLNCGHAMTTERPDEIAALITEFVASSQVRFHEGFDNGAVTK